MEGNPHRLCNIYITSHLNTGQNPHEPYLGYTWAYRNKSRTKAVQDQNTLKGHTDIKKWQINAKRKRMKILLRN